MSINSKDTYPRPDFIREDYLLLTKLDWEFDFDEDGKLERDYIRNGILPLSRRIKLPFCYQSPMSGIDSTKAVDKVWYKTSFALTGEQLRKTVLLKFGAADYEARVWLNGRYLGLHKGGYTPFTFDITLAARGENELVVGITDTASRKQPRGKQFWEEKPSGCHYTPVTGIWQDVWLEFAGEAYIERIKITPDIDLGTAAVRVQLNRAFTGKADIVLEHEGETVASHRIPVGSDTLETVFSFPDLDFQMRGKLWWTPETPNLFDVKVTLVDAGNNCVDAAESYFGMRKISVREDSLLLNNSIIYLRAVLDQGYWNEGIYTPADDEGYKKDVELTKALGFNCARKHQKIESPKYYYWADKLGLMVWGELPSPFEFCDEAVKALISDTTEFIERDYNHPSIIVWVMLNESWGARLICESEEQKNFARTLYHYAKCADKTRLVSTNDGWELVNPTDICGIHDYREFDREMIFEYNNSLAGVLNLGCARSKRPFYANGGIYTGQPVILTECGGAALAQGEGWGYTSATDTDEYLEKIRCCMSNIRKCTHFRGFCYTQLTDVYQEINGLLYQDRTPKVPVEELNKIFG